MERELPTDEILSIAQIVDADRKRRLVENVASSARHVIIDPFTVDPNARVLLRGAYARAFAMVPIGTEKEQPIIAVAEPIDFAAIEYLLRNVPNCIVVSATRDDVERTIDELYW